MPYFTIHHLTAALDYMGRDTHPTLISVLAMLRTGVPATNDSARAVRFGSREENKLLGDYFSPAGSPESRPYFMPFGAGRGYSHWRDSNYAGRTLQKQRAIHDDLFVQNPTDNKKWMLAPDLGSKIKKIAGEVVGNIPIAVQYLAVWCYRDIPVSSVSDAVHKFQEEFNLNDYQLVPEIFSLEIDADLSSLPMSEDRVDETELLRELQALEPERGELGIKGSMQEASSPDLDAIKVAAPPPGDWQIPAADFSNLGNLKGMAEPAFRAMAALSAGMHVIFTGPPGTGKTSLAQVLCDKAGFPAWMVPATDQWTTFETIGGYFPVPKDDVEGDRLDFLPGAVVDSIEKGLCLIIDEINRADIDKAFGELFTLLSGNTVTLNYRRRSVDGKFRRVRLQIGPAVVNDDDEVDVIVTPPWWRLVGSMNDSDKASLKRLSMAFVRRFAFIPVDLPPADIYEEIIRSESRLSVLSGTHASYEKLTATLIDLFARPAAGFATIAMPLGASFPIAVLKHAQREWELNQDRAFEDVLLSCIEAYVAPQFQGRSDLHERAIELFQTLLPTRLNDLSRHLSVWTGYVS